LNPLNHFLYHHDSVLRLEMGDAEGYRRVCREMLAQFANTPYPNVAERTAKTCCLAPGAIDEYQTVVRLAEQALVGTESCGDYKWFLLARGMADYRTAQFGGAIGWLRQSLSPGAESPHRDGLAQLFLAMAHHQLGQIDDARQALDKAQALGQKLPKLDGSQLGSWHDWLRFHIVRREAEELLKKESGVRDQQSEKRQMPN